MLPIHGKKDRLPKNLPIQVTNELQNPQLTKKKRGGEKETRKGKCHPYIPIPSTLLSLSLPHQLIQIVSMSMQYLHFELMTAVVYVKFNPRKKKVQQV